ncbi:ADP-ribosyltransferase [Streptomyces sp. TRM68367]|uniref:ADP-ribosyltransferase n=1 Tax=Streptomyces sp. TRM68367 TaxID=2758415 RepID=UPI00165A6FDC|nr:ADP-ribosyltransferase [Streptomyces sp. TRM68367]MBC9723434.1 hypothetical protein [Streptomyces sp. TRM68367]
MITTRLRRRAAAAALSLAAVLTTTAAVPSEAPATATLAAAPACPQFADKAKAAADRRVDIGRITPDPVWRTTCETLYRADSRGPSTIFQEGFRPRDVVGGQYDLEQYVLANHPSPYVSTTYDHDLYKNWGADWNYYIDAPVGIDVNKTIGNNHQYAGEREVAFPGGVARQYIIGVCRVDERTKAEIMSECESNPYYKPWH